MKNLKWTLVIGDTLALALVIGVGFATHGEAGLSFLPRMFAAFIPLVISWFLLAPIFGLFQTDLVSRPRQIWWSVFAMLFVGPLAVLLRGLILNIPIIPIFAIVFSATSAIGIMVWRGLFLLFIRRN